MMRTPETRSIPAVRSTLALCLLLVAACGEGKTTTASAQEPGDKPAAKTPAQDAALPASLMQTKAEVAAATAQIDMTLAKLQTLADASGDDLKKHFKAFGESVDHMRERGAAYFQEWEEQLSKMTTVAVKDVATKRKDELAKAYADVLAKMQESRAAYDGYYDNLTKIQNTLDEKLDEEALKGISATVTTAKEQAKTLKARVGDVLAAVDGIAVIYTKK